MTEGANLIALDVPSQELSGSESFRRKVVFSGDGLMVTLSELDPGTEWERAQHPEEEVVYVVRGRLEYRDGRVLTDGMLTVNESNQPHPGKAAGDVPTLLIEVYAPPVEALRPK